MVNFYIYYNTHTHTHTYIYIYIYINIKNNGKPEMVHRYWPVSKIYRTAGQTSTAFCTVLTPLPPTIEDIYDLKRLKKKKIHDNLKPQQVLLEIFRDLKPQLINFSLFEKPKPQWWPWWVSSFKSPNPARFYFI